jgi:hypothetical protein
MGDVKVSQAARDLAWRFMPDNSEAGQDRAGVMAGDYDDTVTVQVVARFEAQAQAELVDALRFYADPDGDGYAANVTDYGLGLETGDIINDRGDRARALLARIEGGAA